MSRVCYMDRILVVIVFLYKWLKNTLVEVAVAILAHVNPLCLDVPMIDLLFEVKVCQIKEGLNPDPRALVYAELETVI